MILPKFQSKVAIIVGTGPSLTEEDIITINAYRNTHPSLFRVFGVNNAFTLEDLPLDVFFACNPEWWEHYHADARLQTRKLYCDMWTWDLPTAREYGLNWIEGRWSGGKRNVTSLSTDPTYIHYGHGSGYEVLGLAYHYGCRHFILAGYDLRFPGGYSAVHRKPGSGRHFFGEYPAPLQHWPGASGQNVDRHTGDLVGLLDCYRTIDTEKLNLRITNCSPGSALDFFEVGTLESELQKCLRTDTSSATPR